jgi:hypothetical protein
MARRHFYIDPQTGEAKNGRCVAKQDSSCRYANHATSAEEIQNLMEFVAENRFEIEACMETITVLGEEISDAALMGDGETSPEVVDLCRNRPLGTTREMMYSGQTQEPSAETTDAVEEEQPALKKPAKKRSKKKTESVESDGAPTEAVDEATTTTTEDASVEATEKPAEPTAAPVRETSAPNDKEELSEEESSTPPTVEETAPEVAATEEAPTPTEPVTETASNAEPVPTPPDAEASNNTPADSSKDSVNNGAALPDFTATDEARQLSKEEAEIFESLDFFQKELVTRGAERLAEIDDIMERMRHGEKFDINEHAKEINLLADVVDELELLETAINKARGTTNNDPRYQAAQTLTNAINHGEHAAAADLLTYSAAISSGLSLETRKQAWNHINTNMVLNTPYDQQQDYTTTEQDLQALQANGDDPNETAAKMALLGYATATSNAILASQALKENHKNTTQNLTKEQLTQNAQNYDNQAKTKTKNYNPTIFSLYNQSQNNAGKHNNTEEYNQYTQKCDQHWQNTLKPGAYLMLGHQDAQIYTTQPDGTITTPNGQIHGTVDYKTGVLRKTNGEPITYHDNPRIYANAHDLMRYGTPAGDPGLTNGHLETINASADPGYFSKYEDTPQYPKVKNYLKQIEAIKIERSRRREESALALADHPDIEELYSKIDMYALGNGKGLRVERYDNDPTPANKRALHAPIASYLSQEINAGRLTYDPVTKSFSVDNPRADIADMKPDAALNDLLEGAGSFTEKVSLVNSAKRGRAFESARDDVVSRAVEPKIGRHNAASHRRRNWNPQQNAPKPGSRGQVKDVLISPTENEQGYRDVFVVVDEGKMVRIPQHQGTVSSSNFEDPTDVAMPATEYAIQATLDRYAKNDLSLAVEPLADNSQDGTELIVW